MISLFLPKQKNKKVKLSCPSKTPQLSREQHSSDTHTHVTSGKNAKRANMKKTKKVQKLMRQITTTTGRLNVQQPCGVWGNMC